MELEPVRSSYVSLCDPSVQWPPELLEIEDRIEPTPPPQNEASVVALEGGLLDEDTRKRLKEQTRAAKAKKKVSWIDLEGRATLKHAGPVTEVFLADSRYVYDRTPLPVYRDFRMASAQQKMDRLLFVVVIGLVVVILVSFTIFVVLMLMGVIQQQDSSA